MTRKVSKAQSTLTPTLSRRERGKTIRRAVVFATIAVVATIALFYAAVWWLPDRAPCALPASTVLLDRDGQPLFASVAFDGQWRIPLSEDQINPDLINALVAVEDARFYQHAGVDWRSIFAAAWEDVRHLAIRRGGSTLTMQLARLREPGPRTFLAKIDQVIRAKQIERRLDKRAILVEYLNRAPFGGNLIGAGAASSRYFDKPCAQLSLAQCALLAGLPQSPNRLRPDRFPDRAKIRRDHVLDRMAAMGMISPQRRDQALAEPIDAKWCALPQQSNDPAGDSAAPWEAIAQAHRGQTIRTTIDATIQRHAVAIARQRLETLASDGVDSGAIVVLDTRSAEVLAAVSLSRDRPHVDLTHSPRSTGSTLKTFIYAAAFDAGVCTPQMQLCDAPASWPGYAPANYDRQFRGEISAAEALAESRNIPAMVVLSRVGVSRAVEVMSAIGLATLSRTPDRYGIPLAIGGAEATPIELAEAYATLARGGRYQVASLVCDDVPGTTDVARQEPRTGVLLPHACYAALGAIADPGRTAHLCPEAIRSNVAWKTGTSSGHRDAWCAAVTRRFTVVAWFGNATGRGSSALVGADAAAPAALSLIAALDPIDDPWPQAPLHEALASSQRVTDPLTIVSPADGTELIVTGESQHKIELQSGVSATRSTPQSKWWFVDGTSIGSGDTVDWRPTPGRHELRLIDDAGHSAVARVRIR